VLGVVKSIFQKLAITPMNKEAVYLIKILFMDKINLIYKL